VAIRNRVFTDYVATYREAIATTRYAELGELQPPPLASLGQGGAGTAYVLWRLGDKRRAKAWIAAALADRSKRAYDQQVLVDQRRSSLLFTKPGALWAQAMIVPETAPILARAIANPRLDEHACGAAGHYLAARLVKSHHALARVIAKLGARVVEAVRKRAATPWLPEDAQRFAHGWPGICYAALVHAPTESWLVEAVARLALVAGPPPPEMPRPFIASWCNGATGMLLLWAKAFALTGDARFLDAARKAAAIALDATGLNSGMCCGDIGLAFALLALHPFDKRGGWLGHARALAAREIASPKFRHSNGLYYGHPGLVCLAQDLLDEPRGFPSIES
jgi:hypothetical protein